MLLARIVTVALGICVVASITCVVLLIVDPSFIKGVCSISAFASTASTYSSWKMVRRWQRGKR